MKKFLYTLLMFFVGITSVAYAQQEAATIKSWNGNNLQIRLRKGKMETYEYKATSNGVLYIYGDDQNVEDNVSVGIWGGRYVNGTYDSNAPLQDAGAYENGAGVYGWVKVSRGDVVRFTLTASADAEGIMATFTLKSLFFNESIQGNSKEKSIELTQNRPVSIPVYSNGDTGYLQELSYATFCRFVAPSDGVASIFTNQYMVYYVEDEAYGNPNTLKYATQDIETDDHEFVVKKGKAYVVIVPNSRPTDVTFKMNSTRLGENCKAPILVESFPTTLDLTRGNNFFQIDLDGIGEKYIMEVTVTKGWKGSITYMNSCDYESEELLPIDVEGGGFTRILNLDPLFVGNNLIINYNLTSSTKQTAASTLTLREANEGECFDKAQVIGTGYTDFSGPARDYWFVYTSSRDAEISVATSGTLKHVLYSRDGGNFMNADNKYRLSEGEDIYMCITTTGGKNSLAISEKTIEEGDYCDMPIVFSLGEDIIIKDRGDDVMNYRQFTADNAGFAIFETTSKTVIENYWSIYFRTDCDNKTIDYVREDITDSRGNVVGRSYKIPVTADTDYLFEIMSFENEGADVVFKTHFEEAKQGDVCATAIAIKQLGDTIKIDNTPESTVWHKYVADNTGFYTIYAKIGRGSNLKVKVGEAGSEINGSEDSRYNNAYMAGYKMCKVYVEEGQILYICTTINADPGNVDGTNYYILPTFAEARPGERFAEPIKAEEKKEYTLTTGIDGYEMWYS